MKRKSSTEICSRHKLYSDRRKKARILLLQTAGHRKYCSHCGRVKPLEEFAISSQNACKECKEKKRNKDRSTLRGALQVLLDGARNHSQERSDRGRLTAGFCTLTLDDLLDIYDRQNGNCYYFKDKKMAISSNSRWKMSIERLITDDGYHKANVVLCCLEFNTRCQWTREKILKIPNLREQSFDLSIFKHGLEMENNTEGSKNIRRTLIQRDSDNKILCQSGCDQWKDLQEYYSENRTSCKECEIQRVKIEHNTLKGFLSHMIANAKCRSSNKKLSCTVTVQTILDLLSLQNGKCYYSDIPLVVKSGVDWQMSLERLNVKLGYIDGNVVLICAEFQSTARFGIEDTGEFGAQWSKEKFNEFLTYIEKKETSS